MKQPEGPREKLAQFGVHALTSSELMALVIGTGTAKTPVERLAELVVSELRNPKLSLERLQHLDGIGFARACQLIAMKEFVERNRPPGFTVIDELDKVLDQVSDLRTAQREHLVCLYLDIRLQLIMKETVAIGSVNQSVISPKDIFSVIKQHPISYLILVHNHPSGNPAPSTADLQFTQQIGQGGKLLGVEVLDHVIVAAHQHYSLKQHHQLGFIHAQPLDLKSVSTQSAQ